MRSSTAAAIIFLACVTQTVWAADEGRYDAFVISIKGVEPLNTRPLPGVWTDTLEN